MSRRPFALALLLLALAGAWTCWCDTAMLWDGAYQFCETLITGRAFIYLSRFHSWVVWQPLALLAPHVTNYRLLRLLFGLPYAMAPAVSMALSWWVARRHAPHLALWALFGAALAPLPGEIFLINDSIFQLHLYWPVLLAALLPVSRGQALTIGAFSLFQLSHPMGIGLCLFAAAASLAVTRRFGWPAWLLALALGGGLKLVLWPDNYAASEATFGQLYDTWIGGLRGWPLFGLLAVWLAGACLFSRRLAWAGVVLLLATGSAWLFWASWPSLWRGALNYRRWVAPAAFPFMLAIAWEAWRPAPVTAARNAAGVLAGLVFFAVLGVQSATVRGYFKALTADVAEAKGPWIEPAAFPWMKDNAMEHWGISSQVIMVQGRQPHLLLRTPEAEEAAASSPPKILLKPFEARVPGEFPEGWFHWQGLPGPPHPR